MTIGALLVAHHLDLVGVTAVADEKAASDAVCVRSGAPPDPDGEPASAPLVLLLAAGMSLPAIEMREAASGPAEFTAVAGRGLAWERLRSFHPAVHFEGEGLIPVVTDGAGRMVWAFHPRADGRSLLLIGTDLAADLTLLRQGRPEAADNRPTEAQWGFAGERPNYLFEAQLDPQQPFDRPADWWVWTLRDALVRHAGVPARPVLPGGAPGMIVITGDDDQAPIEDYHAQRELLGDLPVTYFLHPLCKLDRAGLNEIAAGRNIEWELHPDALETPDEYPQRLAEQSAWFEELVGRKPRLVRNHGFLNDGYWGHARPWLAQGIVGSSNVPGVDGRVVNGSLLPARLTLDGELTAHVSLLTAFGDGAMFVHNWDAATTVEAVLASGRRIAESAVPGVLVFNLHPANHLRAEPMHLAAQRLVNKGFVPATLGSALDWFERGEWPVRPRSSNIEQAEPYNNRARTGIIQAARNLLAPVANRALWSLRAMLGRVGRG